MVHAKLAGDASLCPGRFFRKTIRFPGAVVNLFDFRPHFFKMGPDTICAEAYYSGDGRAAFAALLAGAHANVVRLKSFKTGHKTFHPYPNPPPSQLRCSGIFDKGEGICWVSIMTALPNIITAFL